MPVLDTPGVLANGKAMTWEGAILDFFDRYVRNPTQATVPEVTPGQRRISGPTQLTLLSVHGSDSIRYTLDGSEPSANSTRYTGRLTVKPGQTLKAISVVDGLKPSPVITAAFTEGAAAPRITTEKRAYTVSVGKPFEIPMQADSSTPPVWSIAGWVPVDKNTNFSKPHLFVDIDPTTGVIKGTYAKRGTYPLIIGASVGTRQNAVVDAVQIVVIAE